MRWADCEERLASLALIDKKQVIHPICVGLERLSKLGLLKM